MRRARSPAREPEPPRCWFGEANLLNGPPQDPRMILVFESRRLTNDRCYHIRLVVLRVGWPDEPGRVSKFSGLEPPSTGLSPRHFVVPNRHRLERILSDDKIPRCSWQSRRMRTEGRRPRSLFQASWPSRCDSADQVAFHPRLCAFVMSAIRFRNSDLVCSVRPRPATRPLRR